MLYPNLKFPKKAGRPFFYTNFVATLDGKIQVLEHQKDYWPIGSKVDHDTLMELRAYADCLIHGSHTAKEAARATLESLSSPSFKALRKKLGKDPVLPYYVVTNHPENFSNLASKITTVPHNLTLLSKNLYKKGVRNVLMEGGPTLLGSFLKANLIDEVFLTIAPKIFGSQKTATLTLVEGTLFPPQSIKKLKLLSVKPINNEIFLRYKVI